MSERRGPSPEAEHPRNPERPESVPEAAPSFVDAARERAHALVEKGRASKKLMTALAMAQLMNILPSEARALENPLAVGGQRPDMGEFVEGEQVSLKERLDERAFYDKGETAITEAPKPVDDFVGGLRGAPLLGKDTQRFMDERHATIRISVVNAERGLAQGATFTVKHDSPRNRDLAKFALTEDIVPRTLYAEFDAAEPVAPDGKYVRYVDSLGNMVTAQTTADGKRTRALVDLTVDRIESPTREYDVSVDLTAIGGPVLPHLAEGKAPKPETYYNAPDGKTRYPVYFTGMDKTSLSERVRLQEILAGKRGQDILAAVSETEAAMGVEGRASVRQIVFTGETPKEGDENASYTLSTVTLPADWLRDAPQGQAGPEMVAKSLRRVTVHETVHAVDDRLRLSHAMGDLHRSLSKSDFALVKESNFFNVGGETGHPADNAAELVASLFAGLLDADWEDLAAGHSATDRRRYQLLLTRVAKVVRDKSHEINAAPILKILEPAIAKLDAWGDMDEVDLFNARHPQQK